METWSAEFAKVNPIINILLFFWSVCIQKLATKTLWVDTMCPRDLLMFNPLVTISGLDFASLTRQALSQGCLGMCLFRDPASYSHSDPNSAKNVHSFYIICIHFIMYTLIPRLAWIPIVWFPIAWFFWWSPKNSHSVIFISEKTILCKFLSHKSRYGKSFIVNLHSVNFG